MLRFIMGRLFGAVIVLWIIVTVTFFLMRFAPGGPFDEERALTPNVKANRWLAFGMGNEVVSPEAGRITVRADHETNDELEEGAHLATIVAEGPSTFGWVETRDVPPRTYTLNLPNDGALVAFPVKQGEPIERGGRVAVVPKTSWQQYTSSIGNYLRLDFGVTFSSDGAITVRENLEKALPISLELGLWALLFALLLGIPIGLISGLKQNTWVDYSMMSGAMVGLSVPTMVSGPLFVAIFAIGLGWLPVGGWVPLETQGWEAWHHRVLPVITLGLVYTAYFARLTRGGMLEVIRSDFIRTARAKGLRDGKIVSRHAFKGAILPTVSFLGPAMARIITGSVVVERVFGIPGLSEFFVTPALFRDYPMVLGVVVVYSVLLVMMNLLVDIAYTFIDPRVTYD